MFDVQKARPFMLTNRESGPHRPHPMFVAALVFLLSTLACAVLIWQLEGNQRENARVNAYTLASDHAHAAQEHLDRAISAVYALSVLVQQGHGEVSHYDEIATRMLPYYPGVSALVLAPDGIIKHTTPWAANAIAIGLNLLNDPVMGREARLAHDTGKLTLAGPFELKQGGLGLVARLPIFFDDAQGKPTFWGLANVVMRFPQALQSTRLPDLLRQELDYKLWRVNPETGQIQIIEESQAAALIEPVRKSFDVPNGAWTLSVAPRLGWGDPARLAAQILVALMFAALLAYLAKLLTQQRAHKIDLETQVIARTADIRESKLQLAATLDAIPDLLFEMDLNGRYLRCHSPRSDLFAAPVEEMLGKTVFQVLPPSAAEVVMQALQQAHETGLTRGQQFELLTPDRHHWFELSVAAKPTSVGQEPRFIVISRDITERKQAEQDVQQLAYFDALTGLPNRSLLNDRISHALAEASRRKECLALMFLDLDHFKNVNDTLGHRIGDELLVVLAGRMQAVMREQDTVARQGGDEFILLLPNTDGDGAARVAEKLLITISQPIQIAQHELTVTPSMGIAQYPRDGADLETLTKHADIAMYRAKQSGRNGYQFFTTEMQVHASHSLRLENALRRALERDQLCLHYQPQLSLLSGQIVGVEALLRWCHPELGQVSPAEFIPIAETSGQIQKIGEWVLRTAVLQAKQWLAQGLPPMTMSVNLSAVQFRHPDLPALVAQVLAEVQLPPQYLALELTESVALHDPLGAIAVLAQLHQQGVRTSIDDFGTGYSSLSYLKRFQAYQLKIDQSFVRDISDDPDDRAIVSAIINLARSLDMSTIAEGVETLAQLTLLREQGCTEVQGYFFCKPQPPDELKAFLRTHQAGFAINGSGLHQPFGLGD
jgi:diguanylate cyclase (GGDEF)-like protein/PAS domain S-box-containing protein